MIGTHTWSWFNTLFLFKTCTKSCTHYTLVNVLALSSRQNVSDYVLGVPDETFLNASHTGNSKLIGSLNIVAQTRSKEILRQFKVHVLMINV